MNKTLRLMFLIISVFLLINLVYLSLYLHYKYEGKLGNIIYFIIYIYITGVFGIVHFGYIGLKGKFINFKNIFTKKPIAFECYEIHAYSRFAGCKSQCKECKERGPANKNK